MEIDVFLAEISVGKGAMESGVIGVRMDWVGGDG